MAFNYSYSSIINSRVTHEIPTRKSFIHPKDPREKILDPPNTHEKKYWTHELTTRGTFAPMKYPREKVLEPQRIYEKNFWTHEARWQDGTRPTRRTMVRDPQSSSLSKSTSVKFCLLRQNPFLLNVFI